MTLKIVGTDELTPQDVVHILLSISRAIPPTVSVPLLYFVYGLTELYQSKDAASLDGLIEFCRPRLEAAVLRQEGSVQ